MTDRTAYIVEDQGITAEQVKEYLEQFDYRVPELLADGRQAIDKITTQPPDLVLMDINLNGSTDGIEVAREVLDETDVTLIYMTAFGDSKTVGEARKTDADGLIVKPIQPKDLEYALDHVSGQEPESHTGFRGEMFYRWIDVVVDQVESSLEPMTPRAI